MRTFKNKDEALKFITNEMPWGLGAGACRDAKLARKFAQAGIPIVSYGSLTVEPRAGNPGDNFYIDRHGNSINAWGIPNKGFDAHLEELPRLRRDLENAGSQLWVSVSAGNTFEPAEYEAMARILYYKQAAHVVEGNMSCGNMKVGDVYKPIVCYDLDLFEKGVAALKKGAGPLKTSVKLTPTTERRFLIANVEVCLKHGIDYIMLANTVPNSYLEREDGSHGISMVRGGLGGAGLMPIVTGMVQMVAPMLKHTDTKLIAMGGVRNGSTAYHYLKHGAHGFMCTTLLWANNFDPKSLQDVVMHPGDLMTKGGLLDYLVEHGLPEAA